MKKKETYGVEIGDKITCHWENWEENKNMKSTGIVYEVDHEDNFSDDVATFRFKNYQGNECWFCGLPTKIVKANQQLIANKMSREQKHFFWAVMTLFALIPIMILVFIIILN